MACTPRGAQLGEQISKNPHSRQEDANASSEETDGYVVTRRDAGPNELGKAMYEEIMRDN
eukprot:scaffold84244_cov33-Tisochrysis_lutea.AAC.2